MKNQNKEISVRALHDIFGTTVTDNLADEFFMARIHFDEHTTALGHPIRSSGYMALYCAEGSIEVEINLRTFHLSAGALIVVIPGTIIRSTAIPLSGAAECVLIAATRELITGVRFDFARLYEESLVVLENPSITLRDEEIFICRKYFELAESLLASDYPYLRDSILSLGSSLFYYLGNIWSNRVREARKLPPAAMRKKLLFERFMKLVHEHHNDQREVGFYADELCLTPKYLSHLIREASGKSAPEWIDSFVILEAKNLLRYTDLDIKAISFELHFSSPSLFYRFFKSHTGMTPGEYRGSTGIEGVREEI